MPVVLIVMLLLAGPLAAETTDNPFMDVPAAELRARIAAVEPVHKESWYEVEIIVFERVAPASDEFWRLDQQPEIDNSNSIVPGRDVKLPENADEIDHAAVAIGAWQWLDYEQLKLSDTVEKMVSSGDYRILLHQGWHQPTRERNRAFSLYLSGGDAIVPKAPVPGDDSTLRAAPILDPSIQFEDSSGQLSSSRPLSEPEFQSALKLYLSRYLHVEPDAWLAQDSALGQRYWVNIKQKRRMRSNELHYLDHPQFGILLRLTPWLTEQQRAIEQMEAALKSQR